VLVGCGRIGFDAQAAADSSTSSSLVGCWSFDEGIGTSASDCSGNGNSGTLSGATAWTAGKMSDAVSFTGSAADLVTVGAPNVLDFDTGSFSYGLWVKLEVGGSAVYETPMWKGGSSSFYAGYSLIFEGSTLQWDASLSDGVTQIGLHAPVHDYHDGMWHHLFTVIDRSTETESLYLDGARVAGPSSIATLGSLANTNALEFDGDGDPIAGGAIDEARIYNRALSATEVAALFTSPGSR
jgi:hypothetical protein